jgi:TetR/AcrR family transcriptional repressor for divergent bdcA
VTDTQHAKPRGRPRSFEIDDALAKAQALFHERGYVAVSLTDLTEELGINPPSFYAAFGSKAELYGRVLERYSRDEGLDFKGLLSPDRSLAEGLAALFEAAAESYTRHPGAPGCLVIEGTRGGTDPAACGKARALWHQSRDAMHDAIARIEPERAGTITDYTMAILSGISASASDGLDTSRLRAIGRMAAQAF